MLEIEDERLVSAELRLAVPPDAMREVQQLFALEGSGFLPSRTVRYDAQLQAYVVELAGEAVRHLLDLLTLAIVDAEAETWAERRARCSLQLRLRLEPGEAVETDLLLEFAQAEPA